MNTTPIPITLGLALGLLLTAASPTMAGPRLPSSYDENGTPISQGVPYAGPTKSIIYAPRYDRFRFGIERGPEIVVTDIDPSEFTTAAGEGTTILPKQSWEPGYWQDDSGYFYRLFPTD